MAYVEVEVEVGVVDPDGVVDPERDLHQPPAQGLEQVQTPLQLCSQLHVRLVAGRGRAGKDRKPRDMAERVGVLHVQESRIQPRKSSHGAQPLRSAVIPNTQYSRRQVRLDAGRAATFAFWS